MGLIHLACAGKLIPSCEKDRIARAIEILSQMYPRMTQNML